MTPLAQLRLLVRSLQARVDALEGRRARHKRAAAPKPDDAVVAERNKLWAKYMMLEMQHGHGRCRLTKLSFATRHGVNPTEFGRWMSPTAKRGVAEGSKPDRSHRRVLNAAISELEARRDTHGYHPQGNVSSSPVSGARLH